MTRVGAQEEKPSKMNAYVLSCSIVISMISIIFGYGELSLSASIFVEDLEIKKLKVID